MATLMIVCPACGKCKALLPVGKPQPVTGASFVQEVERAPVPVLEDAWALWCGPGHMIAPVIDQLAIEPAGRVRAATRESHRLTAMTQRWASCC